MVHQICAKCQAIPNDILVLECDHSVCVGCAAKLCGVGASIITCPLCRYVTYLDQQIIHEIYLFSLQPAPAPQSGQKDSKKKSKPTNELLALTDTRPKRSGKQEMPLRGQECAVGASCKQHSDYEMMYLCLECEGNLLCPECIIHGDHRHHPVQTLKKTVEKIHAQLSARACSLDFSMQGLVQASEEKKRQLRGKITQVESLKKQAVAKYKLIRQQIDREEAEVLASCAQIIKLFQTDFSTVQQLIQKDVRAVEKEREQINKILAPIQDKRVRKQAKTCNKLMDIKIVRQYLAHWKMREQNTQSRLLWLGRKDDGTESGKQQHLEQLTDRIHRIGLVSQATLNSHINAHVDLNEAETRNHSLVASRARQENTQGRKMQESGCNRPHAFSQSPFNSLKISAGKQNRVMETESVLVKGSWMRESIRSKKKSLPSEQDNFLIF